MVNSLFRQSFLIDSLYGDSASLSEGSLSNINTSYTTDDGVCLKLHYPGALEVIPSEINSQTQHVLVSCGIHGNDAGPIEIVNRIISEIENGTQKVNEHCLFVIANLAAVKQNQQYLDEDLEHLFDDKPREPSKELVIADNLKVLLKSFWENTAPASRWHLDLHSTLNASQHPSFAVSPKVRHPVRPKALIDFIESAHIDAIVLANAPSGSFSWYSADCYSARSAVFALGQASRIGESDVSSFTVFERALKNLIARVVIEHLPKKAMVYRVSRTIVRIHEDFDFLFPEDVENFTAFMHGEVFGHDGEKPLMAKNDGEAILFPNRHVAIGEQATLMVCPVVTRYEQDQLVYD